DWLVEGVALAQKQLPELSFDIYGAGGQQSKLAAQIEQLEATNFIHLKGHHDLTDIYQQYQVYLTASTSEGFGLTLMEAIGSGLPIIGLDVPYGNQTFVENEKNGSLIPRQDPDDAIIYAQEFAKRLIQLYQSNQLDAWHQASYKRAEEFLTSRLEEAWQTFIEEV
ncbi:TPA: glycosyltransferase, partial [Streptococcus suis]|nr:glycosyltransferase [Streptococcus suis]HEM2651650.1 glycosyltransferase [Streptococcus suis]